VNSGTPYASPVTLTKSRENLWRGDVVPLDDEYRLYLKITPREDGSVKAFLRNPERNLGRFIPIDSVEREGETVRFFAAPAKDQTKRQMLVQGVYRDGLLSVAIPRAGGTYDFRRVEAGQASDFHPRGRPLVPYVYRPPRPHDDGWPGFWGGNYSERTTTFIPQDVYAPEWILPAVQDKKNGKEITP
jgi:hypothetical protein